MKKFNILLKKLFYSSLSKLISSLGLIIFNFIIIFYLNKQSLGIFTICISLITFLSIFSKFGLNHATLRINSILYENKDTNNIKKLIILIFLISGSISTLISIFVFLFEKEIAIDFYNNEKIQNVLIFFSISFPIFTFIQLQKSLLRSIKLPELSNFSDIGSILFLSSIFVFASNYFEVTITLFYISLYFLCSCLIIFTINCILIYHFLFWNKKLKIKHVSINIRKQIFFDLPDYFVVDFVNYTLVWGSIFICTFFYNAGTIANFSSIYWLAFSLFFFPLVLNSIYAPKYAVGSYKKNKKIQRENFFQNRNISFFITFPIFLILFIFSEFFLSIFFKITSEDYLLIFRILLINSILRVIFGPQVLFLNMIGRQKKLKFISIYSAMLQIFLILMSAAYFNLVILSISFLISNLIKHMFLKKELRNYFSS